MEIREETHAEIDTTDIHTDRHRG